MAIYHLLLLGSGGGCMAVRLPASPPPRPPPPPPPYTHHTHKATRKATKEACGGRQPQHICQTRPRTMQRYLKHLELPPGTRRHAHNPQVASHHSVRHTGECHGLLPLHPFLCSPARLGCTSSTPSTGFLASPDRCCHAVRTAVVVRTAAQHTHMVPAALA